MSLDVPAESDAAPTGFPRDGSTWSAAILRGQPPNDERWRATPSNAAQSHDEWGAAGWIFKKFKVLFPKSALCEKLNISNIFQEK